MLGPDKARQPFGVQVHHGVGARRRGADGQAILRASLPASPGLDHAQQLESRGGPARQQHDGLDPGIRAIAASGDRP